MSYVVLARRWRPQKFSDLVGQDVVVRTLKNAVAGGQIAHAYLFTGIRGVGKTTLARLLAMAVNCRQGPASEPCGECGACKDISQGANLDVQEMDAASHTGVDDIREILEAVRYPPSTLKYKVYIIDEAHMLSKPAFNALLKTLEEPPERVMFILATTEVEKLPMTVRSRCQRFDLRRLGLQEISAYLGHVLTEEGIGYEPEALLEIARAADGSVRDGLSLVERVLAYSQTLTGEEVRQALGMVTPAFVRKFSEAVFHGDARTAVACLRNAAEAGHAARAMLLAVAEQWHQLSCAIIDPALIEGETDEETRQWIERWAGCWDTPGLDLRYQVLVQGLTDLPVVDERRGGEMLAMRLCALHVLKPPSAQPTPTPVAAGPGTRANDQTSTKAAVQPAVAPRAGRDRTLQEQTPESAPATWAEAVKAYKLVRPNVAAMLEHVLCLDFDVKVRLALDKHQEQTIAASERMAFAEWLGREVHWEPKEDRTGETLSEIWARQAETLHKQLWQAAAEDAHVKLLQRELGATLTRVQPPGTQES